MIEMIYIGVIAGMGLIFFGVFGVPSTTIRRVKLPEATNKEKSIRMHSFLYYVFPFTKKLLEKLNIQEKLKHRVDAAHVKLLAEEFFNLKLLIALFFGAASFFFTNQFEPGIVTISASLGFIIPDIWLNKKAHQRKNSIVRLLPETVDLLGLCVEAGLDFATAVKWIIEKTAMNPMVEELAFVLEEIKWGKPRSQALKDMSKRLNITEVSSFVHTLVQAERMGTPVAEAFAILSEDVRLQRFRRGERIALQAPMKILIPLIFCILPVIAIIIGGPIFLQFMDGGLLNSVGVGK
jgi:tight adherence protein C